MKAGLHRQKAPVPQDRPARSRFGHNDLFIALGLTAGDKVFHTAATGALLIRSEQQGEVLHALMRQVKQHGGCALDITAAPAVSQTVLHLQTKWIGAPPLSAGHRIQVYIEQNRRLPAHRVPGNMTVTVVPQSLLEATSHQL